MKAIGLVDITIRKMKIVKIRMSPLCLIIFYFDTSLFPIIHITVKHDQRGIIQTIEEVLERPGICPQIMPGTVDLNIIDRM